MTSGRRAFVTGAAAAMLVAKPAAARLAFKTEIHRADRGQPPRAGGCLRPNRPGRATIDMQAKVQRAADKIGE